MNVPLVLRALVAVSLFGASATAGDIPPLGIRFVGELDGELKQRIEQAIAQETGRRLQADVPAEQAWVTITASGGGELLIRYEPSDTELTRSLLMSGAPDDTAQDVGLIVQHLMQRDEGVSSPGGSAAASEVSPAPAVPAPPPPSAAVPGTGAPCPSPTICEVCPKCETCPTRDSGCSEWAAPGNRLNLDARFGALGVTHHGGGQGASDLSTGVRLGLQVPFAERFSLGIDSGLTRLSAAFSGDEGEPTELNATTWDLSASAGIWLVPPGGPFDVEFVASFGALIPLEIRGRNIGLEPDSGGSYHGQAGYRAAGLFRGTHWFGDAFGVSAAVGVEFQFSVSNSALGLGPDSTRDHVHVWHTQPVVALGGSYRF